MEKNNDNVSPSTPRITPMTSVWGVVLVSMVLTGVLLWGWHIVVMANVKKEHSIESAQLRAEIAQLAEYADVVRAGTTTAKGTPK